MSANRNRYLIDRVKMTYVEFFFNYKKNSQFYETISS